jgi:predicted SprT family Zn-dependent metalloprotease
VQRDIHDEETHKWVEHYLTVLDLPADRLRVTTVRATFERWLGRRVGGGIGGAYVFLRGPKEHAILINLPRIDRSQPRALEIVVAEELIHMQDHIAGDHRRHAKHGYDRIADRVAQVTGATLDEIRSCLLPRQTRPYRYLYACSRCGTQVPRRVRGSWACGPCYRRNRKRYALKIVSLLDPLEPTPVTGIGEPNP